MRRIETRLEGPTFIEPTVHADARGFFVETYRREDHAGLGMPADVEFVQDNHSRSSRGVVRGMHFQLGPGLAKLVRCARGCITDVVVDVRPDSPTFGQWESFELDDENHRQVFVPAGFAHGFCVTSEWADVIYKQTAYYDSAMERGIAWNDPDIAVEWPAGLELRVSPRDAAAPHLRQVADELRSSQLQPRPAS